MIVTDNASGDGTQDVLARYEREGFATVFHEPDGPFQQREWVTRMARLAATEHGADWVLNSDADEFWWPRGGSLAEVLGAIPRRYGVVQSFVRHFVPVADNGRPFADRMTYRSEPHGAGQRPGKPVEAVPEGRPSRGAGGPACRGRARDPLDRDSAAPWVVPDRVSPLSAPDSRAGRPEGPRMGRRGGEVLLAEGWRARRERPITRPAEASGRGEADCTAPSLSTSSMDEIVSGARVGPPGRGHARPRCAYLDRGAGSRPEASLAPGDARHGGIRGGGRRVGRSGRHPDARRLDDLERRLVRVEGGPARAERALRRALRRRPDEGRPHAPRARRGRHRRACVRYHLDPRRRPRPRDRSSLGRRHDQHPRAARARRASSAPPRGGRDPRAGGVGDTHGPPRGDRARRRLGDQQRRRRVLVAARGTIRDDPRGGPAAVRRRPGPVAALRPTPGGGPARSTSA